MVWMMAELQRLSWSSMSSPTSVQPVQPGKSASLNFLIACQIQMELVADLQTLFDVAEMLGDGVESDPRGLVALGADFRGVTDHDAAECVEPLKEWARFAKQPDGHALDCGHYIPEEAPQELLDTVLPFFASGAAVLATRCSFAADST